MKTTFAVVTKNEMKSASFTQFFLLTMPIDTISFLNLL